jgi:hypothetical protein
MSIGDIGAESLPGLLPYRKSAYTLSHCTGRISREQSAKAAELARELGDGIVTIFLDCDTEGEEGMKQRLASPAQLCLVRLALSSEMHGGEFKGSGIAVGRRTEHQPGASRLLFADNRCESEPAMCVLEQPSRNAPLAVQRVEVRDSSLGDSNGDDSVDRKLTV